MQNSDGNNGQPSPYSDGSRVTPSLPEPYGPVGQKARVFPPAVATRFRRVSRAEEIYRDQGFTCMGDGLRYLAQCALRD